MMRRIFPLLTLGLSALIPAMSQAQVLSQEIGQHGLAATEARLAALPNPDDATLFALGGVRFLSVIEDSLQARWRIGLPEQMVQAVPLLRLPIEENPAPAAFAPADLAAIFRDAAAALPNARAPLLEIKGDFGMEVDLADLWFDVNANGSRDPGEDMLDIAGPIILGWSWEERDPDTPAAVIRFDQADAAWLAAYTHLLQGMSQVILAYDPTVALTDMLAAKAAFAALSTEIDPDSFDSNFGEFADTAYVILAALDQAPDAAALAAAQQNFLAMVEQNRRFWEMVAQESDNDREWLPNDRQQAALGIEVPQGAGAAWLVVLDDLEAILQGELLIPYWRLANGGGIDVGAMFTDPRPINLVGWIQGAAALPYLKPGTIAQGESWVAFENMMAGEAMLFSLFFN